MMNNALLIGLSLIELAFIVRVILRPHREPTSRIAWIAVIAVVPFFGIIVYILFGETNIGRRRTIRGRKILQGMPKLVTTSETGESLLDKAVPEKYQHLFKAAHSISGFQTFSGNSARLFSNSDETIDAMVADIDSARLHVHLLFYIWLADHNGCKIVAALKRAANRGVQCRAMADALGSHALIRSSHWKEMHDAGVHVAIALPIGNPLLLMLTGRIDLRNHRKIVVIDDQITYCGSQNCADAEFRVKAKYAPWVDAVIRFQGPIARQNQHLFASDWMTCVDENLDPLLTSPLPAKNQGFPAQAFGTGPTVRYSAMPGMFELLMFTAQRKIIITTPYYVPDEAMQNGLCAAALRGIDTTIVFPGRNDSMIVAAASRSYYAELLAAGVKIFEYVGGLLHTKSFTIDGEITLIGSANMDRRSFELNYENNILLYDRELTNEMLRLQTHYIAQSEQITSDRVAAWSIWRRLWNNTIAMLGPVL
jgi:cardiolipin synthase A/B